MSNKTIALKTAVLAGLCALVGCTSDKVVTIDHFPVKMGEKWGYIDREGKYVINPQYDVAYGFNEGKAMVKTSKGWAFIEEKPNATPTMAYADALPYSEGVAHRKRRQCSCIIRHGWQHPL